MNPAERGSCSIRWTCAARTSGSCSRAARRQVKQLVDRASRTRGNTTAARPEHMDDSRLSAVGDSRGTESRASRAPPSARRGRPPAATGRLAGATRDQPHQAVDFLGSGRAAVGPRGELGQMPPDRFFGERAGRCSGFPVVAQHGSLTRGRPRRRRTGLRSRLRGYGSAGACRT